MSSAMESVDLDRLRTGATRALVPFLWLQVPLSLVIALTLGGDWIAPVVGTAVLAGAATLCWRLSGETLSTHLTIAVALVGAVSIVVWQFAGHAWQVDMHMYYFALVPMLVAYCDWRVLAAAAGAVALHHLGLNFLFPAAIYPGGADLGRVVLHAVLLLLCTGALAWLSITIVGLLRHTAAGRSEAEAARTEVLRTNEERKRSESGATAERKAAMQRLADEFEAGVRSVIEQVSSASARLQSSAQLLSSTADEASRQSGSVAEVSDRASSSVENVSAATHELSCSVEEIGRQVSESARICNEAVSDATRTQQSVVEMAELASKIGAVVTLINDIAGQTNLLALNATIEAARAGEAGKGFAVVASEVKSLANQTAKATDEIRQQIGSVQSASGEMVQAIETISGTIGRLSSISNAIAAAVEQQGSATREIAQSVEQTAAGTREVSEHIGAVSQTAAETGMAATEVLDASGDLARQSTALRAQVDKFLASIRAA